MAQQFRGQKSEMARRDWLVVVLAAAGVAVAGYLAVTKLGAGDALFCTAGSGCEVVQSSQYGVFLGLPTAAWGAGLYVAIAGLALFGFTTRRWLAAFLLSVVGVAFSLYLMYLSFFVIGAVCAYCVASAVIVTALLAAVLWSRPMPVGRRSPLRPVRVAALGAATAVLTIVVGAGVFATGAGPSVASYERALARHLAGSGAVMYGAYW